VAAQAAARARELLDAGDAELSPAGYLDLLGDEAPESTGTTQDLMLTRFVPQVYERWWRPALARIAKGALGPGMADEHRIARLLLGLSPGDAVLDVACGTGTFSRDFARAVGESGLVVGIDVSETMLERAAADTEAAGLDGRLVFVRGDAEALPFGDRSFDGVCCFAALHLFADPERALDRMAAVLRPGGRIAIFTSVRARSAPLRAGEAVVSRASGMRMFERDEVTGARRARGFGEMRQRITGVTQFVGAVKEGGGAPGPEGG
jgi:SAM-dependent methyltransferase